MGDIACAPGAAATATRCQHAATAGLVARLNPDVIALLGDVQYDVGSIEAFRGSFEPTWGPLRGPIRPAPGNHDYDTAGGAGYHEYFGSAAGEPGKGWYRYLVGGWDVFVLNSNCDLVGCGEGSEQLGWLQAELAKGTQRCTMAYWHHPRFSSGPHGDTAAVTPLFAALHGAGADVVLSGHDHDYERFRLLGPDGTPDDATGIRQFVVGTGGRSLYPIVVVRGGSEARLTDVFGVLELELRDGSYAWKFSAIDGSSATDDGTGACH